MILSHKDDSARYVGLHPLFEQAFKFIAETDLHTHPTGRFPLLDDKLIAIVAHEQGRTYEQAPLECHRRYIDIQLVIEGVEQMGWRPLHDCHTPTADYDQDKDLMFFEDGVLSWQLVPADYFCIFFPEDAHAPLVSDRQVRKLILKVAV